MDLIIFCKVYLIGFFILLIVICLALVLAFSKKIQNKLEISSDDEKFFNKFNKFIDEKLKNNPKKLIKSLPMSVIIMAASWPSVILSVFIKIIFKKEFKRADKI